MKRIIALLLCSYIMCNAAFSQVPFFAGTAGNGNLYGYTSLKICTGHNSQETYSCLQYGIGDQIAVGADISANGDKAYWGTIVRWGKQICPYFGIGAQVTPALDLTDNLKYGHTTAALFLNGNITTNGKLFWCSNTWWGINNGADNTISNWEYLGYSLKAGKGSITPMLGLEHDWKGEIDPDMLAGVYYSFGKWNVYLWGSDFINAKDDLRIVIGADFNLSVK